MEGKCFRWVFLSNGIPSFHGYSPLNMQTSKIRANNPPINSSNLFSYSTISSRNIPFPLFFVHGSRLRDLLYHRRGGSTSNDLDGIAHCSLLSILSFTKSILPPSILSFYFRPTDNNIPKLFYYTEKCG
ncbi:hypothetical protein CEXT_462641 [Caerostris extrusa]|uniref:Cytochrome c biogenesis B n=1 Tax=Caerostris extrusa TaxID=172846 RepID=A0AAV4YFB0_CAEEX|nr:hypothetical protein CEXT_462641 [Caerostris extrusa]